MQFTPLKIAVAAVWMVAVAVSGLLLPVTTPTGWFTLFGFGVVPSVVLLRAWREPAQSISESIQAAIRK
jgi:hypothetical protein